MDLRKGINQLKKIIKSYELGGSLGKFLDITQFEGDFHILCKLNNGFNIKFVIYGSGNRISINLFGDFFIFIFLKNKIEEKTMDFIKPCIINMKDANEPVIYLLLFKLFLDILRLSKNNNTSEPIDEFVIKSNIQKLAYKLDGLYQTAFYKKILLSYCDVFM